jgi:two-component system response regulator RegX3
MNPSTLHPDGPILLIEDDPSISEAVEYALLREGYGVDSVADGVEALRSFRAHPPSLVLLDLMLPRMAGVDVCRRMRSESIVPILIVTARDAEQEKIECLEMGADDYITKPFSMPELISRVRAHLRRAALRDPARRNSSLFAGPVEIDSQGRRVHVRGERVPLPRKEYELLCALVGEAGRLMRREQLIGVVWGTDYQGNRRTLDVHIKRLRDKIELDPHRPRHLKTVRGLGYKFDP